MGAEDCNAKKGNADKLSPSQIDAKYAGRARAMYELVRKIIEIYDAPELAAMNYKKRGRPFKYSHTLIEMLELIREKFDESYRGCEGVMPKGNGPDHSTIFRRINAMDPSVRESLADNITCKNVTISLVPDGTGLTPAARSEYVRVVHKLKRGFFRLTIMINKNTLEIVAYEITPDSVGETKVFDSLLRKALINMGVDPDRRRIEVREQKDDEDKTYTHIEIMADGAYDQRHIFSECEKLDIDAAIRIRKNANLKAGGVDGARGRAVRDQLGGSPDITPAEFAALDESQRKENAKKWRTGVGYGTRWLVEIVISAFKRTYGDSVAARKMENIRREIGLKICAYNRMLQVGREAAMEA